MRFSRHYLKEKKNHGTVAASVGMIRTRYLLSLLSLLQLLRVATALSEGTRLLAISIQ
jgi:hypothetical protein